MIDGRRDGLDSGCECFFAGRERNPEERREAVGASGDRPHVDRIQQVVDEVVIAGDERAVGGVTPDDALAVHEDVERAVTGHGLQSVDGSQTGDQGVATGPILLHGS
ncbi:hypothetical protein SDC9_171474 [bioreactor metagenome]|uniref:Uncharacterized protein n=1 Tax=bioreactor metagenome TaxID=1076179 RepID=A0A645GDD0_9ZZZZ